MKCTRFLYRSFAVGKNDADAVRLSRLQSSLHSIFRNVSRSGKTASFSVSHFFLAISSFFQNLLLTSEISLGFHVLIAILVVKTSFHF